MPLMMEGDVEFQSSLQIKGLEVIREILYPHHFFPILCGYLCLWGQFQLWKQAKMLAQSHWFIDTEEPSVHWHWGVQYLSICLWLNFPISVQTPASEGWKPCLQKLALLLAMKFKGGWSPLSVSVQSPLPMNITVLLLQTAVRGLGSMV